MSSLATSEFLHVLRRHSSEPHIRYATLLNNFDPEEIFCLWSDLDDDDLETAVNTQRLLSTNVGQSLADELGLKLYPHFSGYTLPAQFNLVTQRFDFLLGPWYTKMYQEAEEKQLNAQQWLLLIFDPLVALIRLFARFLGKAEHSMCHGNLLNGFAFNFNFDSDEFEGVKLFNFAEGGSIAFDLEQFCRIIVVVACRLEPGRLSSHAELLRVDPEAYDLPTPGLQDYVSKLALICDEINNNPSYLDSFDLSFLFESPLFWTPIERMEFLKKVTYHLFKVVKLSYRTKLLGFFEEIPVDEWEKVKFICPVIESVFFFNQEGYDKHGYIVKIIRNVIEHFNENYRKWFNQDLTGYQEAYLHGLAEYVVESTFGTTMVDYVFEGLSCFLNDIDEDLGMKGDLIRSIEFRKGFIGDEPDFGFDSEHFWARTSADIRRYSTCSVPFDNAIKISH